MARSGLPLSAAGTHDKRPGPGLSWPRACCLIFQGHGSPRGGGGVQGFGGHWLFWNGLRSWKRAPGLLNATSGDEVAGCSEILRRKTQLPMLGLVSVLVFRRAYKMNEMKPQLLVFKGRPVSPKAGGTCCGLPLAVQDRRQRWDPARSPVCLTQAAGTTPAAPLHTSLSPAAELLPRGFGRGGGRAPRLWAETQSTFS